MSDGKEQTNFVADVYVGSDEPPMASVAMAFSVICAFISLMFISLVLGWDRLPALGSLISVFSNLTTSGIWWYLIGIIGGAALLVATWLGEVVGRGVE